MNLNQTYKAIKDAKANIAAFKQNDDWMRKNMPEKMDAEAERIAAANLAKEEENLAMWIADYKSRGGKRNV